jgi:hypothetical protein
MTTTSLYAVRYSTPSRSCFTDTTSQATGGVSWVAPISDDIDRSQLYLVLLNKVVVCVTPSSLLAYDSTGKVSWTQDRLPNSPVCVANESLYYENAACGLSAVNELGEVVLADSPLPIVADDSTDLSLLWARADDSIAVVEREGFEPHVDPSTTWKRTLFNERLSESGETYERRSRLAPLLSSDEASLFYSFPEVLGIEVDTGIETACFDFPFSSVVEWSISSSNRILVLGYDGHRKALAALTTGGEGLWRFTDVADSDKWLVHPPICSRNNRVYALTESRILAIEGGRSLWEHDFGSSSPEHSLSLADGSVLVTTGAELHLLDVDGRRRFVANLDSQIMAPPVVDEVGAISVLTDHALLRLSP